jgi:HlyD family secretion protein
VGTAVLVAAIGLVVLWLTVVRGGEDPTSTVETFAVRRGPMTVSVLEAGALKAKDPEIICSSLPRRATIISIVPEGTRVAAGDLLVELDVSALVDHCVDHRIMVNNAEAALIGAREALTIVTSQAQSNVDLAKLNLEFAKQDLEKYTGRGGKYENDVAAAEGKIKLNAEERTKAKDYLDWSAKLFQEKYLSKTQLQADQLALQRAELNLAVASNDANLLKQYTYKRQIAQLTSDVAQAEKALERAEMRARATIAQAQANLAAREQVYAHHREMLARHEDEIARGKIYAPTEGMVIYATSIRGSSPGEDRRPLADGVEVWDRQELIYLPRSTSTVAEVAMHEANLQKVQVGLPALVTVDAVPGQKLMGTVTRIAPLADSRNMWMNPDLKVYKTEIALDSNDFALRSGMSCKAEIIVEQYADAVYVPLQSVVRTGGQPTVCVLHEDGTVEERQVEAGLDNNSVLRIVGGLQEGELVLLKPLLKAGMVEPGARLAGIRGVATDDMMQQIRAKLKEAGTAKPWTPRASPEPPGPAPATSLAHSGAGKIPVGGRPEQNANRAPGSERTQ